MSKCSSENVHFICVTALPHPSSSFFVRSNLSALTLSLSLSLSLTHTHTHTHTHTQGIKERARFKFKFTSKIVLHLPRLTKFGQEDTSKKGHLKKMPQLTGSLVFVFALATIYLVVMVNCNSLPSPGKTFAMENGDLDQQQSLQMSIARACEALAYRNLADVMRSPSSPVESFASNIRSDKRSGESN